MTAPLDVGAFPLIAAFLVAPAVTRRLRRAGWFVWLAGWGLGISIYLRALTAGRASAAPTSPQREDDRRAVKDWHPGPGFDHQARAGTAGGKSARGIRAAQHSQRRSSGKQKTP